MSELPQTILCDGITNLRDLGGYRAADGRRVRSGHLYRAAALGSLHDTDIPRLRALRLGTIFDLRGVAERSFLPDPMQHLPGTALVLTPIEPTVGASLKQIAETRAATGEDVMDIMRRGYTAYALEFTEPYRAIFDAATGPAPVLFHCSAGKDRTGFGAALLLTALGVSWGDVMEDYLATNRLWRPPAYLFDRLSLPVNEVLLRVHKPLLETAFNAIRQTYGSVEQYLETRFGLGPTALAAFRDRLLE
jgi:protein-tyrosine phosphatase